MRHEHKVEVVRWQDSRGAGPTWTLNEFARHSVCVIESVGVVVEENVEFLVIAPHISYDSDDDYQYCGEMTIPKVCVLDRRVLQASEEKTDD